MTRVHIPADKINDTPRRFARLMREAFPHDDPTNAMESRQRPRPSSHVPRTLAFVLVLFALVLANVWFWGR